MTSIKIDNVTKTIKNNTVLENINITLKSGVIIGLRGENGSGKTMLMRLISGLIKPTKGKVYINEKELGKDISFPESIGLLIENPAFLDDFSGFKNLQILASVKNCTTNEKIKNTIKAVGLDPEDKKKYKKYSLGMKQRLGIAAALMESPDIILLDEPTNALDSKGIEMVKNLLQKEKGRGALIVISCHDLSILQSLSDEIYLIENGKIVNHINTEKGEDAV
jgi:ABC-2 type transport system ATP-binding protein